MPNHVIAISFFIQIMAIIFLIFFAIIFSYNRIQDVAIINKHNTIMENREKNNEPDTNERDLIILKDLISTYGSSITKPNSTKKSTQIQPFCLPRRETEELEKFHNLIITTFICKPEDLLNPNKHKIPKYYNYNSFKNNESTALAIDYMVALILIASLFAALLEFYRAKLLENAKIRQNIKSAQLSRKCSLADLTVLKHHRKELIRRESILENHNPQNENNDENSKQQQGFNPPRDRRCSFPLNSLTNNKPNSSTDLGGVSSSSSSVGFMSGRRNSTTRKYSMANDVLPTTTRRLSSVNVISDGGVRKLSIVNDGGDVIDPYRRKDSLIIGEENSLERRHHSRLFHRH